MYWSLTLDTEEYSNNQSINTKDTGHNDWDNRLEDKFWLQDSNGADTDSGLCSSIGSSHVGEHESSNHTHTREEYGLIWITKS